MDDQQRRKEILNQRISI